MHSHRSPRALRLAERFLACMAGGALLLFTTGCREGTEAQASDFNPLPQSTAGNHGCATPNQVFPPTPGLGLVDLGGFALGASSRIAADADEPLVFLTGAGATVQELDLTDVDAPVARALVGPGVLDTLLAAVGVVQPAELSGIAVLDDANLVAVEHGANVLVRIGRLVPDDVSILAGFPDGVGGFADGVGAQVRFNFDLPTTVVPTGDGALYVADSGNHAIRQVFVGALPQVLTVTGTGAPGFADGPLTGALFDSPTGLSVACDGRLLVTERGDSGLGGQRLRALSIGSPGFFGGFNGLAETLAGSGIAGTFEGVGTAAGLSGPSAVFSTEETDVYFVDGGSGHFRRLDLTTGLVDCPLETNGCVDPLGMLAGSANVGLTVTSDGTLLFLAGDLGSLFRSL